MLIAFALLIIAAIYWRPRSFPSLSPAGPDAESAVAHLCEHAGVPDRDWRYVVIHHSATGSGGAAAFERYHVYVQKWDSLGYDFVIGNGTQTGDGEIEVGPRWRSQREGAHAGVAEYNDRGIGICLVGDFNVHTPTERQMSSLRLLADCLIQRYEIPPERVIGHRNCTGAATDCPGRRFPLTELRASLHGDLRTGAGHGAPVAPAAPSR